MEDKIYSLFNKLERFDDDYFELGNSKSGNGIRLFDGWAKYKSKKKPLKRRNKVRRENKR